MRPASCRARFRAPFLPAGRAALLVPGSGRQGRGSRATAGCTALGGAFPAGTRVTTSGFSRDFCSCSRGPATAGDVEASAGEEYTRRAAPEHCGQLRCVVAVPIGSFTSNNPQRLQEYSYVAIMISAPPQLRLAGIRRPDPGRWNPAKFTLSFKATPGTTVCQGELGQRPRTAHRSKWRPLAGRTPPGRGGHHFVRRVRSTVVHMLYPFNSGAHSEGGQKEGSSWLGDLFMGEDQAFPLVAWSAGLVHLGRDSTKYRARHWSTPFNEDFVSLLQGTSRPFRRCFPRLSAGRRAETGPLGRRIPALGFAVRGVNLRGVPMPPQALRVATAYSPSARFFA